MPAAPRSWTRATGSSSRASSTPTIIRTIPFAAGCSRNCRWNSGCSTRCRWASIAARRSCARARLSARWSRSNAELPAFRTCWGCSRSMTNRPMSWSTPIGTSGCGSCSLRWSGTSRRSPWCGTRIRCRRMSRRCSAPSADQLDYLDRQFNRHAGTGPLHWAVAPFAPQRCSPKMLQGCAELSHKHDLPVYTHVYETRGQRLIARELFAEHDGSLITYMERNGLLGPKLNIVHSVWITRPEMDRMAAADAGIVLNHLSNLKLKSGIAPVLDLREAGVRIGLGCDNCSGSDVQSIFQAMKTFCLFAAVSDPEPGAPLAHEVLRHATLGNARTAGLQGKVGAIKAGHKADLVLIDLNDTAYLPYNSAARQLVYTETGRGVDSVMIDGRMVMQGRRVTTIDTDALRREVESLMRHFIADYDAVVKSRARALPHMREAHRRMWEPDVGMNRFIARTR